MSNIDKHSFDYFCTKHHHIMDSINCSNGVTIYQLLYFGSTFTGEIYKKKLFLSKNIEEVSSDKRQVCSDLNALSKYVKMVFFFLKAILFIFTLNDGPFIPYLV